MQNSEIMDQQKWTSRPLIHYDRLSIIANHHDLNDDSKGSPYKVSNHLQEYMLLTTDNQIYGGEMAYSENNHDGSDYSQPHNDILSNSVVNRKNNDTLVQMAEPDNQRSSIP